MDLSHITSQSLRRILTLTERKDELVKLVAELETEISKVLSGVAAPIVKVTKAPKAAPVRKSRKPRSSGKVKAGGLKGKILSVLESAGAEGLKIKEIAAKVGAPAANVSVWFSTTGKKLTQKLEPGRYAVKGTKPAVAVQEKPVKVVAAKPVKKAGRKGTPLKEKIVALLEAAGPKGMRVKDIAAKLSLPAANVSVWISTTGKKILNKVEPGVYSVKSTNSAAPETTAPAPVVKAVVPAAPKKAKKAPKARKAAKAPVKKKASAPAKKAFKLPKVAGSK